MKFKQNCDKSNKRTADGQLKRNKIQVEQSDTPPASCPPYTAEEKRWLKQNYRGEFHFLREHG
jgi:hypothetical protein